MLYTLAGSRQAPARLRKLSRNKVPAIGMMVSFVAMLIGVALNYFVPASAFAYITSVATGCGLFVWAMVMVAHMRYRKLVKTGQLAPGAFQMPLSPIGDWFVLAFLGLVTVLLGFNHDTRIALYVTPVWFIALGIGYFATRKHHIRLTPQAAVATTTPDLAPLDDEYLVDEPEIASQTLPAELQLAGASRSA
jgi:AAT family amino acid transporter/D-serine/D-alanine/glycine transporter